MSLDYFSAFLIGIFGAGHCVVMCGGVSTMLCSALPKTSSNTSFIFSYNLGRILSYTLAGAITGYLGAIATNYVGSSVAILRIISGIFLILMGLYIGKWLFWLTYVEKAGQNLWKLISPLSKAVLPVNSLSKALTLGIIWGWLPCGLIYSALTWSLASGSTIEGALLMFSFGLGTLPALLLISLNLKSVILVISNTLVSKITACLLIAYGFYTIKIALAQFYI